jgi:hypothetical protein
MMDSRRANRYASRFYGNVIAALVLYFLLFSTDCEAYDSFCENLGSVCRSECAGTRNSYDYCESNDDWCQEDRAISDQQAFDGCFDTCMDRRSWECARRRGSFSPTLKERNEMAKQKKDRAKEQRVVIEKLNKRVVKDHREIKKLEDELVAIPVITQGFSQQCAGKLGAAGLDFGFLSNRIEADMAAYVSSEDVAQLLIDLQYTVDIWMRPKMAIFLDWEPDGGWLHDE